jgi:hypothetical protein
MKKRLAFLLPFIFCLLTLLTGCVHYDVGVNFQDQHHGTIVQRIELSEQLTNFSQEESEKWLKSIETRTRGLQGRIKRISPQEIVVTIPFSNGQELVEKFNKFFNPSSQAVTNPQQGDAIDLVQLKSEISFEQSNLLLVERNKLHLDVDLRALGVISKQGNIIVSPGSLVDLEFTLNTPWGASTSGVSPEKRDGGHQLVWKLEPGQIDRIDAVFWVPSPLGLGTIGIIVLIVAGFYLKYKRLPLSVRSEVS